MMASKPIGWGLDVGGAVRILLILTGLATAYGQFTAKFEAQAQQIQKIEQQTTRMEHYLSADPEYWRKVAANGDNR